MRNHQQAIDDRVKKRKERAAHVTLMETVIDTIDTAGVNAVDAIFLAINEENEELSDNHDSTYEDAVDE